MSYYDNTAQNLDYDFGVDLGTVPEDQGFDLIPKGDYPMQCVGVELANSKAGNTIIKAQYQILGGEYDNRRIFETFNIGHSNPKVIEIAQRQIKSWVMACGHTGNERLTMALLKSMEGMEFLGRVKVEVDKTGQYRDSNRIGGFAPMPGGKPSAPSAQPAQPPFATAPAANAPAPAPMPAAAPAATPMAQANAGKRPWEK